MIMKKATFALAISAVACGAVTIASPAFALDLHTGEAQGAYHTEFCPAIANAVEEEGLKVNCTTSQGSLDNLETVMKTPEAFGLAQFDLFAREYSRSDANLSFINVRDDIGKECLFLVSKNKLMTNYGDIVASAEYLNFILPPEKSGHAGTFKYLQKLDPEGLGKAKSVTHAASTEDAITQALTSEDGVALFVQFPNPKNANFKLVTENEGHFVPVISRGLLADEVEGRKVYSAEETEVENANWTERETKLVTACTPIVLFTGKTANIDDEDAKVAHESALTALRAVPAEQMRPQDGWFSKLWTSTKSISAQGVEALLVTTEKAKDAASPYVKKAKDAAQPYVEKAKETAEPYVEKTKEVTKPYVDTAKEKTGEAIEAAKPTYEKAKEATKDAYEATKEKTMEAVEAAKPTYEKAKEATKDAYQATKEKTKDAMEAAKPTYDKAKEATKSYYQQAKEYVAGWFASDDDGTEIEKNTDADQIPDAKTETGQ